MIRTVLEVLYLVFFFIIGLPLSFVSKLSSRTGWERGTKLAYSWLCWGTRCIAAISGSPVSISGLEKVPQDEPVLYISNHRSLFDPVHLVPLMKNPTSILAKKELEKIPFLGYYMRLARCEFLDRNDLKQGLKCILDLISHVKEGQSVCIFPEGTRSPGDEMKEFRDGSFKVAQRTGCPIIPIAISGTENVLEEHFPFVKPAPVQIRFGDPIRMDTLDPEDKKHIGSYVQGVIAGMLKENADGSGEA